jgi:type III pantothenate kinase
MILCDIGNSFLKFYQNKIVKRYDIDKGLKEYENQKVYFISVNNDIKIPKNWIDLAPFLEIDSNYQGLGIDRVAVCKAKDSGVIVDAGSAITVDVMLNSVHIGGYILPGIQAYLKSYESISDKLKVKFNPNVDITHLPQNTQDAISYGIILSIKEIIKATAINHIYFTGGDGKFLSKFFTNSIYDETLVFQGMIKTIKELKW